jgi:hypothetical protein
MADEPSKPASEPDTNANVAASDSAGEAVDASPKRKPTPEEQMAQFEEALKEEDWGHQPC